MTVANPVFFLDVSTDWYRQPSVKAAFALSVLVHAAAIALLPGLRLPVPVEPAPLVVELVALPPPDSRSPAPAVEPLEHAAVVRKPAPLQKSRPEPPPAPAPTRTEPQPPAPVALQREVAPEPVPLAPLPEARPETPPPPPIQARPEPQAPRQVEPPPRVEPPVAAMPEALAPLVRQALPALDPRALKAYGETLAQAIDKRKSYPRLARMRNWQGTTQLKLRIGPDGKVQDVSVGSSSGFELLDAAAIRMVQESLPFPELPEMLRGREFTMAVPIAFKLQSP